MSHISHGVVSEIGAAKSDPLDGTGHSFNADRKCRRATELNLPEGRRLALRLALPGRCWLPVAFDHTGVRVRERVRRIVSTSFAGA
jgi:hypothetical protein